MRSKHHFGRAASPLRYIPSILTKENNIAVFGNRSTLNGQNLLLVQQILFLRVDFYGDYRLPKTKLYGLSLKWIQEYMQTQMYPNPFWWLPVSNRVEQIILSHIFKVNLGRLYVGKLLFWQVLSIHMEPHLGKSVLQFQKGAVVEWLERLGYGAESRRKAWVRDWASPYGDWKTLCQPSSKWVPLSN